MNYTLNTIKSGMNSDSPLGSYTAEMGCMISRRQAEDQLRAAAIESAMANRAKSEFLANMSHELRTPLNAVIGFGELVEAFALQPEKGETISEYSKHIVSAGHHLLAIINDILSISEIESGKLKMERQPLCLNSMVEDSISLIQTRAEKKNQELTIQIPATVPPIAADELRLKQILINLLTNASKFTPEGGSIRVTATEPLNSAVTFTVEDNGIGMTEEEIAHALKPFSQVQSTYSRDQEGTGLGLTIVVALVRRHGGSLDIMSEPGNGTTVAVTLPVFRDSDIPESGLRNKKGGA